MKARPPSSPGVCANLRSETRAVVFCWFLASSRLARPAGRPVPHVSGSAAAGGSVTRRPRLSLPLFFSLQL